MGGKISQPSAQQPRFRPGRGRAAAGRTCSPGEVCLSRAGREDARLGSPVASRTTESREGGRAEVTWAAAKANPRPSCPQAAPPWVLCGSAQPGCRRSGGGCSRQTHFPAGNGGQSQRAPSPHPARGFRTLPEGAHGPQPVTALSPVRPRRARPPVAERQVPCSGRKPVSPLDRGRPPARPRSGAEDSGAGPTSLSSSSAGPGQPLPSGPGGPARSTHPAAQQDSPSHRGLWEKARSEQADR